MVGSLGFAALYFVFSISHLFALAAPEKYVMFVMAIATSIVNLIVYLYSRKREFVSLVFSGGFLVLVLCLAALNISVHGIYLNDPNQVVSFALVQLAASVTLTNKKPYILITLLVLLQLFIVENYLEFEGFLKQYSFVHLSVILLSATIFLQRIKNIKITEQLESAQREMYKEQVEKEKSQTINTLAGGVAHEINNPLMILKGNLQIMDLTIRKSQCESEERLLELSDKGQKAITRIADIISQLLEYSNAMNRQSEENLLLTEVIEEVLRHWRPILYQDKIMVTTDIDYSKSYPVMINKRDLLQVFFSLFENSYYHLKGISNSWINISLAQDSSSYTIIVGDSGKAIPDEVSKKIFEPFFTAKPVGDGKGLGLSITKTILERAGATISYDSSALNPTFVIKIPNRAA